MQKKLTAVVQFIGHFIRGLQEEREREREIYYTLFYTVYKVSVSSHCKCSQVLRSVAEGKAKGRGEERNLEIWITGGNI